MLRTWTYAKVRNLNQVHYKSPTGIDEVTHLVQNNIGGNIGLISG